MLSVRAGPDPRDPIANPEPGKLFSRPLERDFRGVNIAWSRDFGGLPVDPRVTAVIEAQRGTFAELGCRITDGQPDFADADEIFKVLRAWKFEFSFRDLIQTHADQLKDTILWNAKEGAKLTGAQLSRAEFRRTELYHRVRRFMERHEFMIFPTVQVPPFDVQEPYVKDINGVTLSTYIDWMKSCYYITVTGLPTISVPCGFTPDGLPIGVQIVGRHQDDFGVLQMANAFESATGFWKRTPPILEA